MTQGCKIDKQNAAYFLTFTIVDWISILNDEKNKRIVCDSLNYCIEKKGLEIYSYVIMSTHMHLLTASNRNDLSGFIRDFKKFTTVKIIERMNAMQNEYSNNVITKFEFAANLHSRNKKFQLWKQNNHPEEVFSPRFTL